MRPVLRRYSRYAKLAAYLCSGLSLWLSSCASTPLPLAAYNAYIADPTHGLTQSVEINGTTITGAYRPTDLLVQQDVTGAPATNPTTRDSLARAYAGKTYCTLSFAHHGQELENQFATQPLVRQRVIDYLQHGIATDAFLLTSPHDSVPAAANFYLQQFGLGGHSTVVLVFATPQRRPTQGFQLTLRGQALGVGYLRFAFTTAHLAALPPLRFD